jgi:hypothetical protein
VSFPPFWANVLAILSWLLSLLWLYLGPYTNRTVHHCIHSLDTIFTCRAINRSQYSSFKFPELPFICFCDSPALTSI